MGRSAAEPDALEVGATVELQIDALAAGGDGVARTPQGRVVFVPLTAPGDRVRARIETLRARYARAELEEVLEPGPGRVSARCPVFGVCGGCAWQHIDYEVQCEAKRRIVEDALRRVGHLRTEAPVTLHASPTPYGYRARARVAAAHGQVGYRRRRSHALCAVAECPILTPEVAKELSILAAQPPASRGDWELAAGADGSRAHPAGRAGPPLELALGPDRLRVSAGVFFQAHVGLHGALVSAVSAAAGRGARLLELHAGAGFFTLALARAFERVVAVESQAAAVSDLRHNLASHGIANVEVLHGSVEEALGGAALRALAPEVVVLDPPRSGLPAPAVEALAELGPRCVAYLSCDPATLARDLALLAERGFGLQQVEAFDLFPQTPHVEVLARLER